MPEFRFFTKFDQTILLGKKARNIPLLLDGVRSVPDASIYYHTHRFLQRHHYLSPEPPNDFAYWTAEVLGNDALGEQFSSIDIVQFNSISELRAKFIEIMESYVDSSDRTTDCPPGHDFYFMASRMFAIPSPYVANSLSEFRDILGKVSVGTIYYHVFDAKLRLERRENDFSRWFDSIEKPELAEEIRRLDPYSHTLEGLRKRISILVKQHDSH